MKRMMMIKKILELVLVGAILLSVSPLWADEFAVIKEDTKFYPSASSKTVFFQGQRERFITVKYLEEKGKRVRVELSDVRHGCQHFTKAGGIKLALWVPKKALQMVTTKMQNFTFKDGSEIELAAGLVARSGKVMYRGEILPIKVPKKMTGTRFSEVFLSPVQGSAKRMSSKKGLRFNGKRYLKLRSYTTHKVGDLDEISDRCRRVRGVLVQSEAYSSRGGGGLGLASSNGRRIPKGIQVYNTNGEKVGVVRSAMLLREGFNKGAFYCGIASLFATKQPVVVCVSSQKGPEQHTRPTGRARMKARMVMGRIKVENGSVLEVKNALRKKSIAIRYCYERVISGTPSGSISLQLKVNASGKVASATVFAATLKSEGVQSCVVRVMERIRFKKTEKGMTINVPFVFTVRN